MDDMAHGGLDRTAIVNRLIEVQNDSIPFLTRELTKYHQRTNEHSYYSNLPDEQKVAWLRYGLQHLAGLYASGKAETGSQWERNLAFSSLGGGFRGVSESLCGMMVVSHLLVPIVRSAFAEDPNAQAVALGLLSDAFSQLAEKSIGLYEGYVRGAFEGMLGSSARCLEDIAIDGLLVEREDAGGVERYGLTERETEVLGLVGLGCSNGQICARTGLKLNTVKGHIRTLLAKTHLRNRTQLALLAVRAGLCQRSQIDLALDQAQHSIR